MGTPRKFGQFARALRELAKVPAVVSREVAVGIRRQVKRDFAAGVDAYGRAYAPLAPASLARGRTPPPLRKYARHVAVAPLGSSGVALTVSHPQAGFHQTGTRHMPKRVVFPDGPMPAAWNDIVAKALAKHVRKIMRRAA